MYKRQVLDRAAGLKLLDYAGQDLTSLQNEVEKLCAYALGQGAPAVTGDMVEELVAKSTETTVFLLAKALVSGQYATAYNLLDTLFYQREDHIAIVGAPVSYTHLLAATAAALLGTFPVQLAVFGGFPLLLPAANFLMIAPGTALLYLGLCGSFLTLLPATAPLEAPFVWAAGWTDVYKRQARSLATFSFGQGELTATPLPL